MSLETDIATRPNGAPPPEIPLAEIQLESLDFWVRNDDIRDAAFATLRREAPISFWPAIQMEGFETGEGYWALTKLDDVHFASRHPEIFSSAGGITINDQTPELAEYFGSMIVTRRSATPAAALDCQQSLHPESGGPHRDFGAGAGPPVGYLTDR